MLSKIIYDPQEDSFLLVKWVKKHCKNKSVLDMGTGTGILAETALNHGAKEVLAVDINSFVINHVKSKGINAKVSNLFSNVKEKFDLILFNPPYLPENKLEDKDTKRITTGGKKGYEILDKFLKASQIHLNPKGKILIVFSSLTDRKHINKTLKSLKFSWKCLETQKLFYEELYIYLIQRKT